MAPLRHRITLPVSTITAVSRSTPRLNLWRRHGARGDVDMAAIAGECGSVGRHVTAATFLGM